jgi:hypothetical protein
MANSTSKPTSNVSSENALRGAYNEVDASLTTNTFLVGKVGHKVEMSLATTNIADDSIVFTFKDGTTVLYAIKVVYSTAQTLDTLSAERIS